MLVADNISIHIAEGPPELRPREGGRVIDLFMGGELRESFECVPAALWQRFKPDAQETLLNNADALAIRYRAVKALRLAELDYREHGPLDSVEEAALAALADNDVPTLRVVFQSERLRSSISSRVTQTLVALGQVDDNGLTKLGA
jgi:hypothetical protein